MNFGTKVTVRRSVFTVKKITRIEIGEPVGSGKTALVEAIAPTHRLWHQGACHCQRCGDY